MKEETVKRTETASAVVETGTTAEKIAPKRTEKRTRWRDARESLEALVQVRTDTKAPRTTATAPE